MKTKPEIITNKTIALHLWWGVLRYIPISIFISLFFEDTLFWMFLATAGIAAWTMQRIALHGRARLPSKLRRRWEQYQKQEHTTDFRLQLEQKEWEQIEDYQNLKRQELPFIFRSQSWYALIAPMIGSALMQILYFIGLGQSIEFSLFVVWVLSNFFLTALFSFVGGLCMRLFLLYKEKSENKQFQKTRHKKDSLWVDRLIASIVLVFYVGMSVLPTIAPTYAADPDCTKQRLTIDEFFYCYDPEVTYQFHSEAIVSEPKRRILIDHRDVPANQNSLLTQYQSMYPDIPSDELQQLHALCQQVEDCNFGELVYEYQQTVRTLPEYDKMVTEDPNLLLASLEGLGGVGEDALSFLSAQGKKGWDYLKENWNDPKKIFDDTNHLISELHKGYQEGQRDRLIQKENEGKGVIDWLGNKYQQYKSDPVGQISNDLGWVNTNILQPYLNHGEDTIAYLDENPQDQWMVNNLALAPFLHAKVYIDSNYDGGLTKFKKDAATALADKNTYWNILKSPFSERTQELATEGKLAQAMGRGVGEMSIEAGQEVVETAATGGVGKVAGVAIGFTVDASKVAKKTDSLGYSIDINAKYQNDIPSEDEINRASRMKEYYEHESRKVFASQEKLDHILKGNYNRRGDGSGFHHNPSAEGDTYIIEGTKTDLDEYGVYEAQVVVNGQPKWTNDGKSTFFPDKWTEQDVVNAINEAYDVKIPDPNRPGLYIGETQSGMQIQFALDQNGKINTAYPIKKEQ